jgi:YD repeat-containing protein
MKMPAFLALLATLLLSSGPANGAQPSSLEGTWYVGGDRNKVARITERRRELEARNEHGQTSRLEYEGRGRVRAADWGGITGEIRGNRIEWSNNTYWTRRAESPSARFSQLLGTWYVSGDRNRVARVTDNRGELEARNERGQTSRLEYENRGRVRAPAWGGITGTVHSDRIEWSNNTYWTRRAHGR